MARRYSLREMSSVVAYYEESGLSRREVAAEAGIAVHTLDYWRRKAARRTGGEFIEIEAPPAEGPATEVVYPNGVIVRFFGAVESGLLLALIAPERRAA